jgi:hypothetical protein
MPVRTLFVVLPCVAALAVMAIIGSMLPGGVGFTMKPLMPGLQPAQSGDRIRANLLQGQCDRPGPPGLAGRSAGGDCVMVRDVRISTSMWRSGRRRF